MQNSNLDFEVIIIIVITAYLFVIFSSSISPYENEYTQLDYEKLYKQIAKLNRIVRNSLKFSLKFYCDIANSWLLWIFIIHEIYIFIINIIYWMIKYPLIIIIVKEIILYLS
jgi:hypothetical protein